MRHGGIRARTCVCVCVRRRLTWWTWTKILWCLNVLSTTSRTVWHVLVDLTRLSVKTFSWVDHTSSTNTASSTTTTVHTDTWDTHTDT